MRLKATYLALLLLLVFEASHGPLAFSQVQPDFISLDSTAVDSTAVESSQADQEQGEVLSVYAQRVLNRFDKSPLLVTILYIIILYSIVTMITLLIIILLNRRRIQREQELKGYLLEKYQELLMDYLFYEEKQEEAYQELNWIANNRVNRQILIDQMIDLSVNLKGEIREVIQALYLRLGLKNDSLEKAYSRKWHKNVKGFRELAFMNIKDANKRIIKSLNSNNTILRMEAQTAMVRLSDDNPYEFLDLLKKPLSLWEQVTLHEMQIQHNLKILA